MGYVRCDASTLSIHPDRAAASRVIPLTPWSGGEPRHGVSDRMRSRLFPRMTRAPHLAAAPAPRRRAVLLSGHYYASKRKANFHFLADSYARQGWDVTFVTTQISPISR